MKIIDVLERVQALYPHPFKMSEMIGFCNELSSILVTKYMEEFRTVALNSGDILPEGVKSENIVRVERDGRILERSDLGIDTEIIYPDSKRRVIKLSDNGGTVNITYRVAHTPIRYLRFKDNVEKTDVGFSLSKEYDIRSGDVLKSGDEIFYVESVDITDGVFKVMGSGSFEAGEKTIERVIDDLTVTDAPFDELYTEFLIAKTARFQKDYETENRALSNYNLLLEDFEKFLIRSGKRSKTIKFYNYY